MAVLVTDADSFRDGRYPEMCALTAEPSTTSAEILADVVPAFSWVDSIPWPVGTILRRRRALAAETLVGRLPVSGSGGASDRLRGSWDQSTNRVVIRGVHDDFVAACRGMGSAS